MPKVTIALITYNRTHYLQQAIEAVLSQTFVDYELIIMDNGSTSDTYEFIKQYLNDKVKYHKNPVNNREYVNQAFSLATGEFLIITHDDDMMLPTMIEKEVQVMDNDHNCMLVGCNVTLINENNTVVRKKLNSHKKNRIFRQYEYIESFFSDKLNFPCPTIMLRKSFFDDNNLKFRVEVGPALDNYLWFEVNLRMVNLVLISEPLYLYRVHNKQDSILNDFTKELLMFEKTIDLLNANMSLIFAAPYLKKVISKLAFASAYAYKSGRKTKPEFLNDLSKYHAYLNNWKFNSPCNRLNMFSLKHFLVFSLLLNKINVHIKKL